MKVREELLESINIFKIDSIFADIWIVLHPSIIISFFTRIIRQNFNLCPLFRLLVEMFIFIYQILSRALRYN